MGKQLDAYRVLRKLDGSPIIYDQDRAWVQLTLDIDTYKTLLRLLTTVSKDEDEPVNPYHRVKI